MNRPTKLACASLAQSSPATCESQDSLCNRTLAAHQEGGIKDPIIVGRTVAKVRDARDISQYELADEMQRAGFDTSRNRIMNWERGRVDISICELAEMARICRTHRIEFVPKSPTASNASGSPNGQTTKRGLSCKVTVLVEFDDDPNQQSNDKKKYVYRVAKRHGSEGAQSRLRNSKTSAS